MECGQWGTLVESAGSQALITQATKEKKPGEVAVLGSSTEEPRSRLLMNIPDVDQVLGGGLAQGSLVLLGGEPGVGKSTFVLQIADTIAQQKVDVLYVSGEESLDQVSGRYQRLVNHSAKIDFLAERDIGVVLATIQKRKPGVVILDSVQTMQVSEVPSEAGSAQQVRVVTNLILQAAKKVGLTVILIGHVTKDGSMAGPKALEHLVDVVLYLEGDPLHDIRLLRSVKNRFGTTQAVGVLRLTEQGLVSVPDAPTLFLGQRRETAGSIATMVLEGRRPFAIDIQALTSPTTFGLPRRTTSGFDVNRLHVLLAVLTRRAGVKGLGTQDVFVNTVGGLKIQERSGDVAVCLAIASSLRDTLWPITWGAIGEVGLGGEIRPVGHLQQRLEEAKRAGLSEVIIPIDSTYKKITGLRVHPIATLTQALALKPS